MKQYRIETKEGVCGGHPVIYNTRIPAAIIYWMLIHNFSIEDIIKEYPQLSKDDIRLAIEFINDNIEYYIAYIGDDNGNKAS